MNWVLAESLVQLPRAESGIHILLDATLKGSVILMAALLTANALRKTSATNRYALWSFAICSLLAIPLLSGLLPKWQVPLLTVPDHDQDQVADTPLTPVHISTESPSSESTLVPMVSAEDGDFEFAMAPEDLSAAEQEYLKSLDNMLTLLQMQQALNEHSIESDDHTPAETDVDAKPDTIISGFGFPDLPWTTWVIGIWTSGALLIVGLLFTGLGRIASLTRSALPLDGDRWTAQLGNLAREAGVQRPVRLLHCRQVRAPLTWGYSNPVILLPTGCLSWSPNRRRVVLLHELVHIRRRDWVMQIVSQLICAAYWFNPLVWVAVRRLAIEREKACDDQVLGLGARPSDYASHLLDIARTLASGGSFTMASIGMAHHSQLEGRLLAILDPKRTRRGFGKIATLTAIVGMGIGIMPLAAVSPWAETAEPVAQTTADDDEIRIVSDDQFNFNWSEKDVRYRLRISGEVEMSMDGVESISDDGEIRITVKAGDDVRKVVITPGDDELEYALTVNGDERKMNDKARRWVKGVIKKAVQRFQEFEEEMEELEENLQHMEIEMEGLDDEMEQLQEELHLKLKDIEIPEIHLKELKELKKLHKLEGLKELEGLHLEKLEGLKALENLHIEIPDIEIEGLHLEKLHEHLEKIKDLHVDGDHVIVFDDDDDHKTKVHKLEDFRKIMKRKGGGEWRTDDGHVIVLGEGDHTIKIPHIEGIEGLEDIMISIDGLEDIHIEMPDIEGLHELKEFKELKGLKRLEKLEGLKWIEKDGDDEDHVIVMPHDGHRVIRIPEIKGLENLHEHLEHFEDIHIDVDDEDDNRVIMISPDGKRRVIAPHAGNWTQRAPDGKKLRERIRAQIEAQMKQLHKQLEQLDQNEDGDFEWNFRFGPDDFKFKDDFKFEGDFEFDHEELNERIHDAIGKYREHFKHNEKNDFKFDHDFEFDMEGLHEQIQEAMKKYEGQFKKFQRDGARHHENIEMHLAPHMEKLHEHLQELQNIEIPDMERLHKDLAPMLKNLHERMPDLENLQQRIETQLQPQMEQLQKRLEVLEKYLEEVRAQLQDEIREVVADEVDSDNLSRSEKRDLKGAIGELVKRLSNDLGMNIDDGVCTFNDSPKRIAGKLNDILEDLAEDFDEESLDRLFGTAKAIAARLSDLEVEVDSELADKIENFDPGVDFDIDLDDFDFEFNDDEEDEDDGWDDGEIAAVA